MIRRSCTNFICIHCTATPQTTTIDSIERYWASIGWKNPGYFAIIDPKGRVEFLTDIEATTNSVKGHNYETINIAYVGGIDAAGKPIDNRTPEQIEAMIQLIKMLRTIYPNAMILGHRDFSGVNKACPSFCVVDFLRENGLL